MSSYKPARGERDAAKGRASVPYPSSEGGANASSLREVPAPPPTPAPASALGSVVPAPPPGAPPPAAAAAAPAAPAASGELSTLWVGSIVPDVTDDDLFDAFAPHGFVTDVNMSEKQPAFGGLQAFVKYDTRAEAADALSASLNRQLKVKGKTVTCRWADRNIVNMAQLKTTASMTVSHAVHEPQSLARMADRHRGVAGRNYIAPKLWIGNLPINTSEDDVRRVCRAAGSELKDIIIHKKPSQYGQLSGFLRFKTLLETEMMMRAISSGAILVNGAVLKADWAKGVAPP